MVTTYGLTVRQPWAWAIEAGVKCVENRSGGAGRWGRAIGSTLLIHAGAGWSTRGADDERVKAAWWAGVRPRRWGLPALQAPYRQDGEIRHPDQRLRFRQIIASAIVQDVHDAHPGCGCGEWGETSYQQADGTTRRDVVHLVLTNVRRLDALPFPSGRLGLWRPPADLLEAVGA